LGSCEVPQKKIGQIGQAKYIYGEYGWKMVVEVEQEDAFRRRKYSEALISISTIQEFPALDKKNRCWRINKK